MFSHFYVLINFLGSCFYYLLRVHMFVFLADTYVISFFVFLLFTFFSENAEEYKSAKPKILIDRCFHVLKSFIVQCPVNSRMEIMRRKDKLIVILMFCLILLMWTVELFLMLLVRNVKNIRLPCFPFAYFMSTKF